jgi:hypothetical protein
VDILAVDILDVVPENPDVPELPDVFVARLRVAVFLGALVLFAGVGSGVDIEPVGV